MARKSKKKDAKQKKTKQKSKKQRQNKKITRLERMEGKRVPNTKFRTRERYENRHKGNNYRWKTKTSNDLFKNKKVVVFSLPGAFTPTCSNSQLPDYEKNYNKLKSCGVDDVYCLSVNDAFVMHNWKKDKKVNNIKLIPDGNGDFTRQMGALVKKNNLGFGDRSWRYSMLVDNGNIEKIFSEPHMSHNHGTDPFVNSDVHTMLKYLQNN